MIEVLGARTAGTARRLRQLLAPSSMALHSSTVSLPLRQHVPVRAPDEYFECLVAIPIEYCRG
ncbi:hypothetical protein RHOER0001_4594 [Rhodococcus erythropolis SK121]|nr:hypothetical protein RHOER0001_4594 [Rhodococcus erythropolis SK121]